MNINITFGESKTLDSILNIVKQLELKMSVVEEALQKALEQQDTIQAGIDATVTLVREVKQLLEKDATPNQAAIDLLNKIEASAPQLAQNIATVRDTTAAVDAVNGDPAVAPAA